MSRRWPSVAHRPPLPTSLLIEHRGRCDAATGWRLPVVDARAILDELIALRTRRFDALTGPLTGNPMAQGGPDEQRHAAPAPATPPEGHSGGGDGA